MIDLEHRGPVAVLRMAHGKVNAMDVEMLEGLAASLADLEAAGARVAVIAGNDRVFSAGLDLGRFVDEGTPYVEALVAALSGAFVAVLRAPFPIVAAVNGAAVAGGAVLAAACDRRLIAPGARIGAPELLIGVPFPVAAIEALGLACGAHLDEVIWTGQLYEGDEARRVGFADEVVAGVDVVDRAVEVATTLAGMRPVAASLAKSYRRRDALERIAAGRAVDEEVLAVWTSDETRAVISAYVDSTLRRA